MGTNFASVFLRYAHVQMAAEAFWDKALSPEDILTLGNDHSSKFTPILANEFVAEWDVIAHKPNTTTGFSGSLFKHNSTGEYVLSFRSTEFIGDQINDSEVTNKGIKDTGWAFGQIADVWGWVDQQDQVLGRRRGRDAQGLQPRRASCLRSGSGFGQCGSSLLVTFCAKCFTFTST